MEKRNLYLHTTPVEEAKERYYRAVKECISIRTEEIPVDRSLGRVTAEAVYARLCSPLFNASAMDGIAVEAKKTRGASEEHPLVLRRGEDFQVVDTGDPIREPYDAVIMAEDLLEIDEDTVQIMAAVAPWNHIRPIGEDIVAGEMLLPGHHRIRPVDIGVLLGGGILNVRVHAVPRVGIIPTGTEMIPPGQEPEDGQIIDSNSGMFAALVQQYGGEPDRFPIIHDDYEKIRETVKEAVSRDDLVIVNAGSSAGTEDYTVHVLRELGEVLIHGVAIKPGKPVILAIVDHKPVIGLPGYPVSAYIDFETFVKPVIEFFTGSSLKARPLEQAVISKRLVSSLKHKEYVRVKVGEVNGRLVASPLARGAAAATSLVKADGVCIIDQNLEGYEAGEQVQVELWRPKDEIRHTIVSVGSHDLIMDFLADLLPDLFPGVHLSSTHVGSMAGLMALKRGEAHIAPTHLLDEETGVYNIAYLKRIFPDREMALIKGVSRIQGLMVKKGNPKGIRGVEDLPGCRCANRQRGAGTRVLLDHLLKQAGIRPEQIEGYELEAATHMAAAALVKDGGVDAAMGIYAAAKAMDLSFIEVGEEEYDFAIERKNLELPFIQDFIQALQSEPFKSRVKEAGGYGTENAGKIILI